MKALELKHGPLDGMQMRMRRRSDFIWVDIEKPHIARTTPGPDRVLYRLVGGGYVYAGHTHAICGACGVYHETIDGHVRDCSLCGGDLAYPSHS